MSQSSFLVVVRVQSTAERAEEQQLGWASRVLCEVVGLARGLTVECFQGATENAAEEGRSLPSRLHVQAK